MTFGMAKLNVEPSAEVPFREYPDLVLIEEFISEVATIYNRGIDKASEWLNRLKVEDIETVGDLRKLQEEDWQKLNLTVFATRALKNVLAFNSSSAKSKSPPSQLSCLSPRVTGKVPSSGSNDEAQSQ